MAAGGCLRGRGWMEGWMDGAGWLESTACVRRYNDPTTLLTPLTLQADPQLLSCSLPFPLPLVRGLLSPDVLPFGFSLFHFYFSPCPCFFFFFTSIFDFHSPSVSWGHVLISDEI